jgi:hypothetical protein
MDVSGSGSAAGGRGDGDALRREMLQKRKERAKSLDEVMAKVQGVVTDLQAKGKPPDPTPARSRRSGLRGAAVTRGRCHLRNDIHPSDPLTGIGTSGPSQSPRGPRTPSSGKSPSPAAPEEDIIGESASGLVRRPGHSLKDPCTCS